MFISDDYRKRLLRDIQEGSWVGYMIKTDYLLMNHSLTETDPRGYSLADSFILMNTNPGTRIRTLVVSLGGRSGQEIVKLWICTYLSEPLLSLTSRYIMYQCGSDKIIKIEIR